jgi:hypothetical protein
MKEENWDATKEVAGMHRLVEQHHYKRLCRTAILIMWWEMKD